MFGREKKIIWKNKYAAYVLSALLLTGTLSSCATGNGGRGMEGEVSQDKNQSSGTEEAQIQEATVDFEGQDIAGNTITSDIFGQSKLTMINVWATYCNPCLSEMPELGELAGEYDASQFQLIGIISDVMEETKGVDAEKAEKAKEEAKNLIEITGADYPHLLLNASLFNALLSDVTAVPTTFFIDQEGNILGQVVGARDKDSWKEIIDAFLEEL